MNVVTIGLFSLNCAGSARGARLSGQRAGLRTRINVAQVRKPPAASKRV